MKISVLGQVYDLIAEEGMFANTGNHGIHSLKKMEVRYDPDMKPSVRGEAILHELCESMNFWMNLELPHHKLSLISTFLYAVLKDNPDMRKILFEGEHAE